MFLRRVLIKPCKTDDVKIINIGNIVCGGTGKTPFNISLSKFLVKKKFKIAISVRGYKSKLEYSNQIICTENGINSFAEFSGDEPLLLAKTLKNIPIIVGRDRVKSINILKKKFSNLDYIILEDSFQNLRVFHDFDFILFNKTIGIGNGFVMPSGYLREKISALKYANCIITNGSNSFLENLAKTYQKQIVIGEYIFKNFYDAHNKTIDCSLLRKTRNILISGIALPREFEKTIKNLLIPFEKHYAFADHMKFSKKKLPSFSKIDFIIVTQKDFMKLQFLNIKAKLAICEMEYKIDFTSIKGFI